MSSINSLLRNLSQDLYISHGSGERISIQKSIGTIKTRLSYNFSVKMQSVDIFGSYQRGTILPRKYDERSDIDLLIMFNTTNFRELTAATYRNQLKDFANKYYSSSQVKKDYPTVVLDLQIIKFDLVPCIYSKGYFGSGTYYIPDSSNDWQETDPYNFNHRLSESNRKYNYIVKPIIRLMKYWNANAGYPIASYDLEQDIAEMNFSNDDYQSGLFYAIDHLPYTGGKIDSLRRNNEYVKDYLEDDNYDKAIQWLKRIIPFN